MAQSDTAGSVGVRYDDLDLNQSDGAATMLHRLSSAAMEACGASDFSLREYRLSIQDSRCYASRVGRAVAELNAPAVTALYDRDFVGAATSAD
jgi:UrcA family protein